MARRQQGRGYVPLGDFSASDEYIRDTIQFFWGFVKAGIVFVLVIFACFLYVLFTDGE